MSIPHSVLAAGWIPFVIVLVLVLLFSFLYIRYFQSRYESEVCSTLTAVSGLSVALLTSALVPVDIFLVSFMKDGDGHFKEWAKDEAARKSITNGVLYGYYALYAMVVLFVFFILPLADFYYEEGGDEDTSRRSRCCTAIKYSAVFVFMAGVLFLIGGLVPWHGPQFNSTDTEWQKIQNIFKDLGDNHGENAISFTVSALTLVGMLTLIIYTGYGLSAWPMDLVKGRRSVTREMSDVTDERTRNRSKIDAIKRKYAPGKTMSGRDQRRLQELEDRDDVMARREQHLHAASASCLRRCGKMLRPLQIVIGVVLLLLALLIFISLLLTNIDKVMHSLGLKMGYALPVRKLPNPLDMVLVFSQKAFPLDYILMCGLIVYFVLCSMGGIQHMGIWFCWIRMYKIRPRRTKPQGLLFLCFLLMFIVLAMNVLVYQLSPQYTSYGSQHYWHNTTVNNGSHVNFELKPCGTNAPEGDCVMTRMSYLLLRFFLKLWFFGAAYFWLSWGFLAVVFFGFFVTLIRRRRSSIEGATDEDDFNESDEDLVSA